MHTPNHPYSEKFTEHYWSGGADEKAHIYLHGNNLPTLFAQTENVTVAELGFGTGLTFLLTLQLWQATATPASHLTYISYEIDPIPLGTLQDIQAAFPEALQPLSTAFLATYAPHAGWNTYTFGNVTLKLYAGDATEGLKSHPQIAHCWYLDAFSTANNPQLWQTSLLSLVAANTILNGTATTYSVASMVKENLTAAGFHIAKVKGFPPKQYMLFAIHGPAGALLPTTPKSRKVKQTS